jgi:hypothetical protein
MEKEKRGSIFVDEMGREYVSHSSITGFFQISDSSLLLQSGKNRHRHVVGTVVNNAIVTSHGRYLPVEENQNKKERPWRT